ncbi:MAG: alpha/beta hydrolase [Acidobacteriia bacterium]|nr:alpha/beta hydrolase [Terriglobia bacterium]
MDIQQQRERLASLVKGVLAVRPLVDALKQPVCVVPVGNGSASGYVPEGSPPAVETFINRISERTCAPRFRLDFDPRRQSVFETVVSNRLGLGHDLVVSDALFKYPAADEVIEQTVSVDFDRQFFRGRARSFDGALLRCYTAGSHQRKTVVLVAACGMPAKLCERWMRFLAKDYFVITWESRLLFESSPNGHELAYDVSAQVADLFAVMDHFNVRESHLMGLCGGAVIAVSAAAGEPGRITSLSLWHGDYELGPHCPKTKHQKDLKALMAAIAAGKSQAENIHKMFSQNILKNFPPDLAHFVLYPYANPDLLFLYGRSNGKIMETDVTPLLSRVTQPVLVVTSRDDNTAHPEGSKFVAGRLPRAQLLVENHGDHLALFDAAPNVTEAAAQFLAAQEI